MVTRIMTWKCNQRIIKGKSVVDERFTRTLKTKYINIWLQYQVYIDKLYNMVNKYNNTYHSTIKMKPVDVKFRTYIDFGIENNEKNPKFKVGDHKKIS